MIFREELHGGSISAHGDLPRLLAFVIDMLRVSNNGVAMQLDSLLREFATKLEASLVDQAPRF